MSGPLLKPHEVDATAMTPVDCRWVLADPDAGREAYRTGHLPEAIYMSLDADLSDMSVTDRGRHPLPSKARFAATLGRLGISNDTFVVAYDDAGGAFASRLWWMLRWLGHSAVAVLDGGVTGWVEAGGSLTTDEVELAPTQFLIGEASMPTVERADLIGRAGDVTLVDARFGERFRGETEPLDPVAGHIPGAVNVPYADNLVDGRFRSSSEVTERFRGAGVGSGSDTVVYCGSGVTACHVVLAMEVAGMGTPALYPGSWSEWSRAGGSVATGG